MTHFKLIGVWKPSILIRGWVYVVILFDELNGGLLDFTSNTPNPRSAAEIFTNIKCLLVVKRKHLTSRLNPLV